MNGETGRLEQEPGTSVGGLVPFRLSEPKQEADEPDIQRARRKLLEKRLQSWFKEKYGGVTADSSGPSLWMRLKNSVEELDADNISSELRESVIACDGAGIGHPLRALAEKVLLTPEELAVVIANRAASREREIAIPTSGTGSTPFESQRKLGATDETFATALKKAEEYRKEQLSVDIALVPSE